MVRDLALSIGEIHKNTILQCHGDLRTNRCVVDERFVLRLLITRLKSMKKLEKQLKHTVHEHDPDLLWTAPELLLRKVNEPTPSSDTYSFAVIVHEIIFQRGPFYVREIQGLVSVIFMMPAAVPLSNFRCQHTVVHLYNLPC